MRPDPKTCSAICRWAVVAACLAAGGGTLLAPHATAAQDRPVGRTTAIGAPASAGVPGGTVGQLVVKMVPGADIASLNRRLGSTTRSVLLASHSVFLIDVPLKVHSADLPTQKQEWVKQAKDLVKSLSADPYVVYAEINTEAGITEGERFHHWPMGGPSCSGSNPGQYTGQPAATRLSLNEVHRKARGARRIVAVIDTGVDLAHPALAGRIAARGYDYIDDDSVPNEVRDGIDRDGDRLVDDGYGHGTFVAGIAALVAPEAKILPMRVLDSEGRGNVFMVAEAVYDAVDAGADVINMSFGTADKLKSRVLEDAVKTASKRGIVVTAAAGNDGSNEAHYPAAMTEVISVAAESADGGDLASFSARGKWVDVAAPGERIVSALPCGYGSWSGTSMAAPFVAGAVAVLASTHPGTRAQKVVKSVDEGCDPGHGLEVRAGAMNLLRSLIRVS